MAPKQSRQKFIAPVAIPVKKSPSLKDIIKDPSLENTEKEELLPKLIQDEIHIEVNSKKQEPPFPEIPQEISPESKFERIQEVIPDNINKGESQPVQESQDSFLTHWNNMLDAIFNKVPTVYYSLKNYQPDKLENDILITVKNELQKDEIEGRQREILSYFRNNYNNEIDKIKIIIDANLESKVVILDNREKMKILKEQNSDINNFIEILKLKMDE